jgi:hypothetical protein
MYGKKKERIQETGVRSQKSGEKILSRKVRKEKKRILTGLTRFTRFYMRENQKEVRGNHALDTNQKRNPGKSLQFQIPDRFPSPDRSHADKRLCHVSGLSGPNGEL